MAKLKRVFVIYNGKKTSTSGNLFDGLAQKISQETLCNIDTNPNPSFSAKAFLQTLMANIKRSKKIIQSDILIVHSYLIFSLPSLLLARIFRKKIIAFQWDIYPSTLYGKRLNTNFFRTMVDWFEGKLSRLAHRIVVPSEDFLPFVNHPDTHIIPLWPTNPIASIQQYEIETIEQTPEIWRICFAGQVTPLRALEQAVEHLTQYGKQPCELHVFSGNLLPESLTNQKNINVHYHGHLPLEMLHQQLSTMHFGLISLHPGMDQPGFPSKVFDFLSANLPILYFGAKLPAFTTLLEESGIGYSMNGTKEIDFKAIYQTIKNDLPKRQACFLRKTQLDSKKLENILSFS